jgi:hypothetical protein
LEECVNYQTKGQQTEHAIARLRNPPAYRGDFEEGPINIGSKGLKTANRMHSELITTESERIDTDDVSPAWSPALMSQL